MIGFESEETQVRKLRERLRATPGVELTFGKALQRLDNERVSGVADRINRLEEVRREWRRRNRKGENVGEDSRSINSYENQLMYCVEQPPATYPGRRAALSLRLFFWPRYTPRCEV
jgi:hypothetical protein